MALLDARPNGPFWGRAWVEDVLGHHLPGHARDLGPELRLCGWSVGTVLGNETLVQSRPMVRNLEVDPVDELLRRSASCTVATFAAAKADEKVAASDSVKVARFQRWIGVRHGPSLSPALRASLHEELPAFLARDAAQRTDAELVFLRLLAFIHEAGALGQTFTAPDHLRAALSRLAARLPDGDLSMFVSDGRTLGIVHRGGTLLVFEPPADVRPRRRWSFSGEELGAPAAIYLWLSGPPPDAAMSRAERIAHGVLSAQAVRPNLLVRD